MFPTVRDYDADNARKTDWFLQFHAIDESVARQQASAEQGRALGGS